MPAPPSGAKGIGSAQRSAAGSLCQCGDGCLRGTGVRNIDMPLLPDRVYEALTKRHDVSGAPPVKMDES